MFQSKKIPSSFQTSEDPAAFFMYPNVIAPYILPPLNFLQKTRIEIGQHQIIALKAELGLQQITARMIQTFQEQLDKQKEEEKEDLRKEDLKRLDKKISLIHEEQCTIRYELDGVLGGLFFENSPRIE
jgi:hypothetical protein